jgi:Ring finger domain
MNRGSGSGGQRNRPYDNTLLNDLHEIMPEAMYDSDLFNSPILRFFQQRVGHMFPVYHRERGLYLREQADSRRHAFRSTRLSRMPNPVVQPPPVAPTWPATIVQNYDPATVSDTFLRSLLLSIVAENAAAATAPATAPASPSDEEEEEAPVPPPRPVRNVHRIIRTERAGITVTIPGGTTWWDPVSVRPTVGVYNRNTALVDASGVPAGTVCTICQSAPGEDLSGATVQETVWRKLRGCQHFFHKRCADRWFESHIQCPNCRADIRTLQTLETTATAAEGDTLNV